MKTFQRMVVFPKDLLPLAPSVHLFYKLYNKMMEHFGFVKPKRLTIFHVAKYHNVTVAEMKEMLDF